MARTNRPPKRRRDWKPVWLEAFRETGTVSAACQAAKVGRTTVYEARVDADFAQAWDDVESETTDRMEREAFRRGVEGVDRAVFHQGEVVGMERQYSDTLLIFMLKSRKPHVYRENVRLEHTGPDGGPVLVQPPPDAGDRALRAARLLEQAHLAGGDQGLPSGNGRR